MYTAPVMVILTANASTAYVYGAKLKDPGYIIIQSCVTVFKDEFSTHHTNFIPSSHVHSLQSLIKTVIVVLELATVMESATTVVNKHSVPSDAIEVVSTKKKTQYMYINLLSQ